MYLSQKIRSLIFSSNFLQESFSELIPVGCVQEKYEDIRDYLLTHCKPGDRVAIHLSHGPEYLLSILACLETGFTFVPLKKEWPQARVEQVHELAEPKILLNEELFKKLPRSTEQKSLPSISPEDIAYIIFTSGSTGAPKGVMIRRSSFVEFVRWLEEYFVTVMPTDRVLFIADFTFDMSLLDVGLVIARQPMAFFSKFSGNVFRLASEIMRYKISSIATVPNTVMMLLQESIVSRADFSTLRFLLLGGSRFSAGAYAAIFKKYHERFANDLRVLNFYGPTEATVYTHVKELSGKPALDMHEVNVSVGKPFGVNACLLMSPEGQTINEPYRSGELYLSGAQILTGYFKDVQATKEALTAVDGVLCYKTGDMTYKDEKSEYFIHGRLNETIKRRGFRISLLDIDSYVQKIAGIVDCATIAIPDDMVDHKLILYAVTDSEMDEKSLKSSLAKVLLDYQVPDQIVFLKSLPLNASGKVCRKTLIKMLKA
jgi:acyl-coenzyme A synthetase/AMP-(fatty) acid ligase